MTMDTLEIIENEIINEVLAAVSKVAGIDYETLCSRKRTAEISLARQYCYYYLKKEFNWTLKGIGKKFNRDHSTVISGISKIEGYLFVRDAYVTMLDKRVKKAMQE